MILSAELLARIFPKADAKLWASPLAMAMSEFAIDTPLRAAHFLAQVGHESIGLTRTSENLHYSKALRIAAVFSRTFPTPESAEPYVGKPEKLANKVYAGKLGNGDEASGDGWRFRGRGPIQLTGRQNYREAGTGISLALEQSPDAVNAPTVGARVAGWFWHVRHCNDLADQDQLEAITARVNGPKMLGLEDRRAILTLAKQALAA